MFKNYFGQKIDPSIAVSFGSFEFKPSASNNGLKAEVLLFRRLHFETQGREVAVWADEGAEGFEAFLVHEIRGRLVIAAFSKGWFFLSKSNQKTID